MNLTSRFVFFDKVICRHVCRALTFLLAAGLFFTPMMRLSVSALQDGTPADAQGAGDSHGTESTDGVPAENEVSPSFDGQLAENEVTPSSDNPAEGGSHAAEQVDQESPLGIQQNSLQQIQQDLQQSQSQQETGQQTTDTSAYTAEDIACHGAKVLAGAKGLYSIRINRAACTVTVYQTGVTGEQIPFRAFICSASQWTPTGQFSIQSKVGWSALAGGVYGQYCMPITGPYWFHSVPYYSRNEDDLEYEEFNKLGENVSLGCVRLMVQDVKWIFDNCVIGTPVEIYDDIDNPGPLGQPKPVRIDLCSPKRGWDPTDPDPDNPWIWQEVVDFNNPDKAPMVRENELKKDCYYE